MDLKEFRRVLGEFSRQARTGRLLEHRSGLEARGRTEAEELAGLAETLERRVGIAESSLLIKSDTISFAPGKCVCCGK